MVLVNDEHPFDVAPEDDGRPADRTPSSRQAEQPASSSAGRAVDPGHLVFDDAIDDQPASHAEAEGHLARRRHRRIAALSVAAAVLFTAGAGGGAAASLAFAGGATTASTSDTQQGTAPGTQNGSGSGTQNGFGTQGGFGGTQGGFGGGQGGFDPRSGSGSSTATDATAATADQITGIVTIVSQLRYQNGEAAGTGIVLTSNGRILTNNHVIDGATSIRVTVQSTGRSYTAEVVGTNATKDVAVLQLQDASGLTPADLSGSAASVGDEVTAVGNANGTGTLSAAKGTVSALNQTITTSSEGATSGETLHGLIEIDADVVSGDSGGAVEDADGAVIGVTTAASSGTSTITGYAIPIGTALSIAKQIVAGDDTAEITIGLPAFLGVSIDPQASGSDGAVVGQVLSGTAAASTSLAAGDTITAVDGTAIDSGDALSTAIAQHRPGERVRIAYTDADGANHTVTVTLTEGPAD